MGASARAVAIWNACDPAFTRVASRTPLLPYFPWRRSSTLATACRRHGAPRRPRTSPSRRATQRSTRARNQISIRTRPFLTDSRRMTPDCTPPTAVTSTAAHRRHLLHGRPPPSPPPRPPSPLSHTHTSAAPCRRNHLLEGQRITHVYLCGLSLDGCVQTSALHAAVCATEAPP